MLPICYQYVTNMFHICLFCLWVLGGSREWWSWEHLLFLWFMECLYGINISFTHQHASVLYTLFATPCQLPSWFTWQMTKQNQNVVQRKNPTQIQPEYAWIIFWSHHIIYRFRGTSVSVGKNMCLYLYNISKLVKIGTMKWGNTISAWCRWLDNLQIHIYRRNTCLLMFIVSLSVCTTSSLKKKTGVSLMPGHDALPAQSLQSLCHGLPATGSVSPWNSWARLENRPLWVCCG